MKAQSLNAYQDCTSVKARLELSSVHFTLFTLSTLEESATLHKLSTAKQCFLKALKKSCQCVHCQQNHA